MTNVLGGLITEYVWFWGATLAFGGLSKQPSVRWSPQSYLMAIVWRVVLLLHVGLLSTSMDLETAWSVAPCAGPSGLALIMELLQFRHIDHSEKGQHNSARAHLEAQWQSAAPATYNSMRFSQEVQVNKQWFCNDIDSILHLGS